VAVMGKVKERHNPKMSHFSNFAAERQITFAEIILMLNLKKK
jgi:hypothetical protein